MSEGLKYGMGQLYLQRRSHLVLENDVNHRHNTEVVPPSAEKEQASMGAAQTIPNQEAGVPPCCGPVATAAVCFYSRNRHPKLCTATPPRELDGGTGL